jgi:Kdo2-lipid IVA lauroyltransferase/acyltransferase
MSSPTQPPVQGFEPVAPATASDRLQYAAVRVLVAILRLVGWRAASAFGGLLGRIAFSPVGIRRSIVQEHLRRSFPEWSAAEVNTIAKAAYDSFGRTSIQTAILPGTSPQRILELVPEVEGWDILEEALALGKGIVAVSGHIGNWELGGAYISARGVPTGAITRRMANPLFDQYLRSTRRAMNVEVIHDAIAMRRVPRALAEGKMIAFMCDQDALGLASTFVPFFGRPARTPRGPGVFAFRLGTPVIFAACLRRPDGRYRMVFDRVPVENTGDRHADVDRIVAAFTARLEAEVRREPGQYFWHHRRWKRQPPPPPAPEDSPDQESVNRTTASSGDA